MNGVRILIVEDEAIVSMELEERLAAMGYRPVGSASRGEEALKLTGELRPDLVLMDIRLQGAMDGIEAAREILSRFRTPVIFVTAYSEDSTLERAKLAEPYAYILKPFDDRELRSSIEIALYKHEAEEEIRRLNRLYDVLSQVNQSIVRIQTREELLPTICRLVVEHGALDLAWIGWLDSETFRLTPEAHFGNHVESLIAMQSAAGKLASHESNPMRAMRAGKPSVCNECGSGSCLHPSDKSPAVLGFQSCGSFPLRLQGKVCGALTLCAAEKNFFRDREITLLEEVALDISFALDKMEGDSQRTRTERALRVSEQQYRDVLEASGEFIWESDPKGRLSYVSERVVSILGYSPEELVGRSLFDFMAETEAAKLEASFLESTQAKAGFRDLEHRILTRSGGAVWLSVNRVPVLDATGELIGYRGTSRDITERKRAEKEMAKLEARLRQAQKLEAIGTLAGGIAHDFNNILTPIMGYTEMALDELSESSPMRYDLNQVLAAACRAKDLVKQILTFSRFNQDQLMRPVDISLVVKEALKLLRASLPTSIEIRQNIQKGMVVADATQIHQVIVNLCTNAAHAMEERGILEVSLTQVVLSDQDLASLALSDLTAGSYLRLSVRDTGHGMTGDIMEHIFEPYFTTKQVGDGTGLGLAVVHGIAKKHGGEIRVQSTPGVGSVFEVYLPLAAGEASQEVGPSQGVPRGTESILVVDDEPMITEMGGRLLGQLGYSVTAKTDPREALGLLLANPDAFHLVITDYTMPYMTGVELAQGILKVKPGMPIILCTGFNERMSAEMVHEAGITELVIKPFDQKHLAELIRRVLEPQEASRDLLRSSP